MAMSIQWEAERNPQKKPAGMHQVSQFDKVAAQLEALTKKVDALSMSKGEAVEDCTEEGMEFEDTGEASEMVSYVTNKNFNNSYSQAYTPANRNHPNFGYKQPFNKQQSFGQSTQGTFAKQQPPPGYAPQVQPEKKASTTDDLLAQLVKSQQQLMQTQVQFMQAQQLENNNTKASIRNLEVQVGQLPQAMQDRQAGTLPSNTQNNPIEQKEVKAVNLRSGKVLKELEKKGKNLVNKNQERDIEEAEEEEDLSKKQDDEVQSPQKDKLVDLVPPPPFPNQLKKNKLDQQFKRFLDIFKKLEIKIPFA